MTYEPNVPNPPTPPRGDGGGHRALYFIVGGLVVLAAVFIFIFTRSDAGNQAQDADLSTTPPAATEPAAPAPEQAPATAPDSNSGNGGTTTTQ